MTELAAFARRRGTPAVAGVTVTRMTPAEAMGHRWRWNLHGLATIRRSLCYGLQCAAEPASCDASMSMHAPPDRSLTSSSINRTAQSIERQLQQVDWSLVYRQVSSLPTEYILCVVPLGQPVGCAADFAQHICMQVGLDARRDINQPRHFV